MMFCPRKKPPTPIKTLLVEGYESYGDDKVFQRFWLLIQYSDGRRVVEKQTGGILPIRDGLDRSIPSRVRAWELGEPMAPAAIIDLTKLDRALEKAVQNG